MFEPSWIAWIILVICIVVLFYSIKFWRWRAFFPIRGREPVAVIFFNICTFSLLLDTAFDGLIPNYPCTLHHLIYEFVLLSCTVIYGLRAIRLLFHFEITKNLMEAQVLTEGTWFPGWYVQHRRYLSFGFLIKFIPFLIILFFIWPLTVAIIRPNDVCTAKGGPQISNILAFVFFILFVFLFAFIHSKLRKHTGDAFSMKLEYQIVSCMALTVGIIRQVFTLGTYVSEDIARLTVMLLDIVIPLNASICMTVWPVVQVYRYYGDGGPPMVTLDESGVAGEPTPRSIALPTPRSLVDGKGSSHDLVSLKDVLQHPQTFKIFCGFLKSRFATEYALFWEVVYTYKRSFNGQHCFEIYNKAIHIWTHYLQPDSPFEVKIKKFTRDELGWTMETMRRGGTFAGIPLNVLQGKPPTRKSSGRRDMIPREDKYFDNRESDRPQRTNPRDNQIPFALFASLQTSSTSITTTTVPTTLTSLGSGRSSSPFEKEKSKTKTIPLSPLEEKDEKKLNNNNTTTTTNNPPLPLIPASFELQNPTNNTLSLDDSLGISSNHSSIVREEPSPRDDNEALSLSTSGGNIDRSGTSRNNKENDSFWRKAAKKYNKLRKTESTEDLGLGLTSSVNGNIVGSVIGSPAGAGSTRTSNAITPTDKELFPIREQGGKDSPAPTFRESLMSLTSPQTDMPLSTSSMIERSSLEKTGTTTPTRGSRANSATSDGRTSSRSSRKSNRKSNRKSSPHRGRESRERGSEGSKNSSIELGTNANVRSSSSGSSTSNSSLGSNSTESSSSTHIILINNTVVHNLSRSNSTLNSANSSRRNSPKAGERTIDKSTASTSIGGISSSSTSTAGRNSGRTSLLSTPLLKPKSLQDEEQALLSRSESPLGISHSNLLPSSNFDLDTSLTGLTLPPVLRSSSILSPSASQEKQSATVPMTTRRLSILTENSDDSQERERNPPITKKSDYDEFFRRVWSSILVRTDSTSSSSRETKTRRRYLRSPLTDGTPPSPQGSRPRSKSLSLKKIPQHSIHYQVKTNINGNNQLIKRRWSFHESFITDIHRGIIKVFYTPKAGLRTLSQSQRRHLSQISPSHSDLQAPTTTTNTTTSGTSGTSTKLRRFFSNSNPQLVNSRSNSNNNSNSSSSSTTVSLPQSDRTATVSLPQSDPSTTTVSLPQSSDRSSSRTSPPISPATSTILLRPSGVPMSTSSELFLPKVLSPSPAQSLIGATQSAIMSASASSILSQSSHSSIATGSPNTTPPMTIIPSSSPTSTFAMSPKVRGSDAVSHTSSQASDENARTSMLSSAMSTQISVSREKEISRQMALEAANDLPFTVNFEVADGESSPKISDTDIKVALHVFDYVQAYVYNKMERDYWDPFVRSPDFKDVERLLLQPVPETKARNGYNELFSSRSNLRYEGYGVAIGNLFDNSPRATLDDSGFEMGPIPA